MGSQVEDQDELTVLVTGFGVRLVLPIVRSLVLRIAQITRGRTAPAWRHRCIDNSQWLEWMGNYRQVLTP